MPSSNEILNLIWNNPVEIGRWLGFDDLTELHNKWIHDFIFGREDETLLAHRGSFKTSSEAVGLVLRPIVKPNENIIYFRKTDTDVTEIMRQASKMMHKGCIREIVRILYHKELMFIKDTDTELHTNLSTSPRGASQIVALGIGTSVTGKHGDLIVTDDIVNIKDRISRAEREKTKLYYSELQNIKNRGGRIFNTGTPWHKDDAISDMPNQKKYDCYSTGLISKEELKTLREGMPPSLFAANYELRHIASEESLFSEPQFTDDVKLILGGRAHIDAAYEGSDNTAFTIMRQLPDQRIIAFGKKWRKHVDDCLGEITLLHNMYQAGSISNETNADKGYLRKELETRGFVVNAYHEQMNKYIKISTYLRKNWKRIYWIEDTDPEYLAEILDYTENAEHDDSPDSAASLLRSFETAPRLNKGLRGGL